MKKEISTNTTKSLESKFHTLNTEAPNTFLIPISFVRCSATNEANPNKPRQEIIIASKAKKPASLPTRTSLLNFFAYSSSAN